MDTTNSNRSPLHTPLASALLAAWQHEYTVLGEAHLQDALRIDTQRVARTTIPSACISVY